jgi:hypothetical protein
MKTGRSRPAPIKSPALPVKYAGNSGESAGSGFDATACEDYVMGS